jgi:hypothetical protein
MSSKRRIGPDSVTLAIAEDDGLGRAQGVFDYTRLTCLVDRLGWVQLASHITMKSSCLSTPLRFSAHQSFHAFSNRKLDSLERPVDDTINLYGAE